MPENPLSPDSALPTTPEARAAYLKAAQEACNFSSLHRLFEAELTTSPTFREAMAPCDPAAVERFVSLYCRHKATIWILGPRAVEAQTERFLKYREAAAERLQEIQQKKLFDLQCRWRAEEITLPGIRHHGDFATWSRYIDHCSWLPPITAQEVALYAAYLRSDTYRHEHAVSWQSYEAIKVAAELTANDYDSENEMPGWYEFHNKYTDAGKLLLLFDLRGTKEEHYMAYYRAENSARVAAIRAQESVSDPTPRPPSCLGLHDVGPLLERFEASDEVPRLQRWRQAALDEQNRSSWQLEHAHTWFDLLHEDAVEWPLVYDSDWRLALRATGIDYWRHQVADVLLDVWQEQEQHRALGLPLSEESKYSWEKPFAELTWDDNDGNWYTQALLRGRELAGEPRDFNF